MAKMLTDAAVRHYRPTKKRRTIRDAGARSLYLVVEPSGRKSWLMRFRRLGGKPGKMILGPLDLSGIEVQGELVIGMPLTLAGARQVAAQVHRERALGRDPVAEHKARKHRHQAAAADRAAAHSPLPLARSSRNTPKSRRGGGNRRHARSGSTPMTWSRYLADWRSAGRIEAPDRSTATMSIRSSTRLAGSAPRHPIRNGGASEARALALCAALSTAFGWMHRRRLVDANPCSGIHRPSPPRARDRVLTSNEVRRFWHATETLGRPFGAALRLLLLTGCRLNEIANLRWDEISDDGAEIRLPGSRTKNHRAHIVPLAPLAREIIASIPRIDGCEYAFSTNGRTAISGWSKTKTRLDAMMDVPAWRLHDLRRTAVTGMAELGIPPHVIELVVNHVSGSRGGVAGIYNRSEMMPERRTALERWAAHVAGLVDERETRSPRWRNGEEDGVMAKRREWNWTLLGAAVEQRDAYLRSAWEHDYASALKDGRDREDCRLVDLLRAKRDRLSPISTI